MAQILPFAGIRPLPELAASVSSRSPDRYTPEELQDTLNRNPHSFLQIIFPDHADGQVTKPGSPERLRKIKSRYVEFRQNGYFLQDTKPVYYIYRQETPDHCYTGIIACSSVNDYEQGVIKIHEQTLTDREEKLKEYLEVCDYNSEPILFCYPDHALLNQLVAEITTLNPEYDFTTRGEMRHRLWLVSEPEKVKNITNYFGEIPAIYIADGHHRSASSAGLARDRRMHNPQFMGKEPWNFFMGIYFPESELRIVDYNRLVKDLQGLDLETLLSRLGVYFEITPMSNSVYTPDAKFTFSLYADGQWFKLKIKPEFTQSENPAQRLDAALLTQFILSPILGIHDLKNDKRIGFLEGTRGPIALKEAVDSGKFAAAFGLYPVQMQELKNIADAGEIMPPKTTWVEPKLRNGLVVYPLS
jgi:uncharacterized protein (DUF1015 family)